jgi:hypothetical protein
MIDYSKATNKYDLDIAIRNHIEYTIAYTRYFYTAELFLQEGDPINTDDEIWEDGYLDRMFVYVDTRTHGAIILPFEEYLGLFNQVSRKQYSIETKYIHTGQSDVFAPFYKYGKVHLRYCQN